MLAGDRRSSGGPRWAAYSVQWVEIDVGLAWYRRWLADVLGVAVGRRVEKSHAVMAVLEDGGVW